MLAGFTNAGQMVFRGIQRVVAGPTLPMIVIVVAVFIVEAINVGIEVGAQYNNPQFQLEKDHNHLNKLSLLNLLKSTINDKPLSTSMQCVLAMTFLYLAVYGGYNFGIAMNQIYDPRETKIWANTENVFHKMTGRVQMAPMLAILFVGVRLRAFQLDPATGAPPQWAQIAMQITTSAVYLDVLMTGMAEAGIAKAVDEATMVRQTVLEAGGKSNLNNILTVLAQVSLVAIYAGFTTVLSSLFVMEAPQGNVNCPDCIFRSNPPLPPALWCLIVLTTQYFGLFLAIQIIEFKSWYRGNTPDMVKLVKILESAKPSLQMCPLLAVIFISARLRAQQCMTEPQTYAQIAFFVSSLSLLGQTLAAIFTPYLEASYGEKWRNNMRFIEYLLLGGVYIGTVVVIGSIAEIAPPPEANMQTPAVAPPVLGAIDLVYQYFGTYLLIQMARTFSEVYLGANVEEKTNLQILLEATLPSLELIPMISVFFIAGRLRSMEVDPKYGQLQEAQFWIDMIVYAILAQSILMAIQCWVSGGLEKKKDEEEEHLTNMSQMALIEAGQKKLRDGRKSEQDLRREEFEKKQRQIFWGHRFNRLQWFFKMVMWAGLAGVAYNIIDQVDIAKGRTNWDAVAAASS